MVTLQCLGSEFEGRERRLSSVVMLPLLNWLHDNLKLLGVVAILLCVVTWALDLAGLVHPCVYCRTQRTAIGLAGVIFLFPNPRQWWLLWGAAVICFFGANISVAQLFLIVRHVNDGETFGVVNLVMASGALFTLTGQALLLFTRPSRERRE
jgi:disulfide bond formation protein DsbB